MQLFRQIETLFWTGTVSGLTDGQLLERFVQRRDEMAEAAFAALVDRHGAMVLRVCQQVLGDEHDAQDASQATFLVLARKAGSIGRCESVGCWLHGVAMRVAAKARVAAARRRAHERRGGAMAAIRQIEEAATTQEERERWAALHEELGRLPETFRAPMVLCYLEGLTQEQAAAQLRTPLGTIQSRLARGRAKLKARLEVRGVNASAAISGAAFTAAPSVPALAAWAATTVRLAVRFPHTSAAKGAPGSVPAAVAEEVLRAMLIGKIKILVGMILLATVLVARGATGPRDEPQAKPEASAAEPHAKRLTKPEAKAAEPRDDDPVKRALKDALPAATAAADPYLFTFALIGLAKAQHASGDRDVALATFHMADQVAGTVANAHLRRLALMRTAVARGRIGDKEPAWATLDRFAREAAGLSTDARYNLMSMVIDFQFDAGFKSEARANLKAELAIVEAIADDRVKDGGIYRLLHNQIKLGDYDGALRQAEHYRHERSNFRASLLEDIVRYRSSPGDPPAARMVVERALDLSREVTYPYPRARAQSEIAAALARAGDIGGALTLARALGKEVSDPSFNIIREEVPAALAAIARAQAKAGAPGAAKETLHEAFAIAQTVPQPNSVVLCERVLRVVEAQGEIGDVEGAKASAALIENDNVDKALALAAVARAQAKAGDAPGARATLHDALTFASGSLALPNVIN
ncbi:MAG: RNA polymerase sigma factor, partial [Isosphaerales bacterium]